jgi:hypothetical protein
MQKDQLPKLKLDGFTIPEETKLPPKERKAQPEEKKASAARWRKYASRLAEKAGLRIEWKKDKGGDEVDLGYRRLLVKTGICAALAIAILIIGTVTTPGVQNAAQPASDTMSREFDIPEDIGRLKFVKNLDDDVQSVMSVLPDGAAVYPSDGEVVTAFGQAGSKGVRFSAAGETAYSIAKGTVTAVGAISGQGYVKLVLDTGETALYCNLSPLVAKDDIVMPGQTVGTLTGDYLYVEMKDGDTCVDPLSYISARAAEDSGAS